MAAVTDFSALRDARDGETPYEGLRHALMTNVVECIARSGEPFVLRGGLLTRAWIAPLARPTRDLDFVGDFAFDIDETARRFRAAVAGSPAIELSDVHGLWLDSDFPGVRLGLQIGAEPLGVDIGFRDPLVPAAIMWPCGVRAVRPELQLAWKLHGLAEMGDHWRPKDLADAWLIATRTVLVDADLPEAITVAFTSRGATIADARALLALPRWTTKTSRVRWATARGLDLAIVIANLRARLSPILEAL